MSDETGTRGGEGVDTGGWQRAIGMTMTEVGPERVRGHMVAGPRHHQPYGIVHGGVYCSIVEGTASMGAAMAALARGARGVVGVSNTTDFLRPHSEGELEAVAEPVHVGRTQQLWQVVIRRTSDHKPVARGQVRLQVLDTLPGERAATPDR